MKMKTLILGKLVVTPGIEDLLFSNTLLKLQEYITRHASGDFGDMCKEDLETNKYAFNYDERVLSSYIINDELTIWIVTEADRSCTTILLPDEY